MSCSTCTRTRWWNEGTPEGTECRPGTDPMWGYDGAPEWATITDGAPRCQFQGRDISPASDRAFQNFYFDTDGIQSAFVETWGKLAGEFADEPAVAGFDLLNEPGFGETAPVTTSFQLGRFYDRAIEAIRAAGAPQIVFAEPSILWSGLGFDSGPPPGFTDDANIVFSPHLYSESITMDRSLGLPPIVVDGAPVRARAARRRLLRRRRCGRASTATGARMPTGSSASAGTPTSRTSICWAAPTGSGSRRAAIPRAGSTT